MSRCCRSPGAASPLPRGLQAMEGTAASEQLVSIPAGATVSLKASESSPFRSWVSEEFWSR